MLVLVKILACLTSAGAMMTLAEVFIANEGSLLWTGSKSLMATLVIMTAVVTFTQDKLLPPVVARAVLFFGAMALIMLGSAGIVWTYHLGLVTGDLEAWVILVCLLMIAQGWLSNWYFHAGVRQA